MSITRHRYSKRTSGGFSLIEVMLAVGVVAVALVAVLGLLPIGINASRQVADDTVASQFVADILHWRSLTPYDQPTVFITDLIPGADDSLATGPRPKTFPSAVGDLDFDANGYSKRDPLYTDTKSSFYNKFSPYFRVTYTIQDHPQFPGAADVAQVVVRIDWPVYAAAANQQHRVYVSNFARSP